jgi:nucleoside-diphosphate-sugar epimerase
MKIFVAGATGGIGTFLVPMLVTAGHDVVAMTRSPGKADGLRAAGAEPVVADGLDKAAVTEAVQRAEPEVVIHQMTALTGIKSFKRFDDEFALTNRLRTEGLDHLIEAAQAAGARRLIAQSYGNWNYVTAGGPVKAEEDPLDPDPPAAMTKTMAAIRYLETAVTAADGIEGLALRYANFYGPGANIAEDGNFVTMVRKRRFPIVGDGAGVWSFIHYEDAAAATMAAIDRGEPGVYNIADDEPAPVATWLPELARILGAKRPRRVPVWVGRLVGGEPGLRMFTTMRGASNTKARRELGWEPGYPSWRDGFRRGLGTRPAAVRTS